MKTRAEVEAYIEEHYPDEEIVLLDGLDDSIIGFTAWMTKVVPVYDVEKIIDNLMREGMDRCEATEFYDFNIARLFPYVNMVLMDPIGRNYYGESSEPRP